MRQYRALFYFALSAGLLLTGSAAKAAGPDLTGTALTDTTIRWAWTEPGTFPKPGTYQLIDASDMSTILTVPDSVLLIDESVGTPTNFHHLRLIKATDNLSAVTWSTTVMAYSFATTPTTPNAASLSTGSAVISWDTVTNSTFTRYEVALSTTAFAATASTPVVITDNHLANSYGITDLTPGTTYTFRIRAFNGKADDNSGTEYTTALESSFLLVPAAPTLTATAVTQTSIQWDWTASTGVSANDGEGYNLYAAGGGLLTNQSSMTHTETSLTAGSSYGREVEAFNASGASPRTAVYAFTLSNTPINPVVQETTQNTTILKWDINGNGPATSYEILIATEATITAVISTKTVTSSFTIISNLFPGASYHMKVRALSGGQIATPYTTVVSTVTPFPSGITRSSSPPSAYILPADLLGLWHFDLSYATVPIDSPSFDHRSATRALDGSTLSNTAFLECLSACTSISTPVFTSAGPPDLNNAVELQGLPETLVRVPHDAGYNAAGALTISAWANPATANLPSGAAIIAKGDGGSVDFVLDVFNGAYRFMLTDTRTVIATSTIRVGEWDHVMGVYKPSDFIKIYINGIESNSNGSAIPGARTTNTKDISIGNRKSASASYNLGFRGKIDDVKIINRELSAAEAMTEYLSYFPAPVNFASPNDGIQIVLPPNGFPNNVILYVSSDPLNVPIRPQNFASAGLANLPTGQILIPGSLIEIVPTIDGVPYTGTLGSSATVLFPYNDSNGDGVIDGLSPPVNVNDAIVYTLDTTVLRWDALPTTFNSADKQVSFQTSHFSIFVMLGPSTFGATLSQARVYPVPWLKGSESRFDAADLVFDDLPVLGTILILTMTGEKVVELPFSGADMGRITWDGTNHHGLPVASGVYFALVRSAVDSSHVVLKFAIEK